MRSSTVLALSPQLIFDATTYLIVTLLDYLEKIYNEKRSSLLRYIIICGCKKVYRTGSRSKINFKNIFFCRKTFLSFNTFLPLQADDLLLVILHSGKCRSANQIMTNLVGSRTFPTGRWTSSSRRCRRRSRTSPAWSSSTSWRRRWTGVNVVKLFSFVADTKAKMRKSISTWQSLSSLI